MSSSKIILEEVIYDDYVIEGIVLFLIFLDYHQYLNSKLQNKIDKEINKKEKKLNKEKIKSKNKKDEISMDNIILNDNWNNDYIENHFLNYKNSERISLLEIK